MRCRNEERTNRDGARSLVGGKIVCEDSQGAQHPQKQGSACALGYRVLGCLATVTHSVGFGRRLTWLLGALMSDGHDD